MDFIVKNTTKFSLFDIVCPDRCRGCGELGSVLCGCCKNDIILEKNNHCAKCGRAILYKCEECSTLPFSATFAVGYRDEIVGELAKELKFSGARRISKMLAEILDEFLPDFGEEIVLVPLPTIQKHIRERGVDHTLLIAKKLARRRGWNVERVLGRKKNTVQVGANEVLRRQQAKEAYFLSKEIDKEKTYMLLDDFWTTGASMTEAGRILKRNGAKKIVATVIATSRKREKLGGDGSTRKGV